MPPFDFVMTFSLIILAAAGLITSFILYSLLREARQQQQQSLNYAQGLARSMHNRHFSHIAPHWEPYDDLVGVLTQIDNMASGFVRTKP